MIRDEVEHALKFGADVNAIMRIIADEKVRSYTLGIADTRAGNWGPPPCGCPTRRTK